MGNFCGCFLVFWALKKKKHGRPTIIRIIIIVIMKITPHENILRIYLKIKAKLYNSLKIDPWVIIGWE